MPKTADDIKVDTVEKKRPRASSRVKKRIRHRATLPTSVELEKLTDKEVAAADALVDKGVDQGSALVQQRYEEKVAPYLFQIAMMTREGSTRAQVASFLGMSTMTLDKYLKLFPKLKEAFEVGKRSAEDAVVESLVRLATGYPYIEVEETEKDAAGGDGKICTRKVHYKMQHPNVTATIFYLLNRCGSEWTKSANSNHYVAASTLAIGATGISDATLASMLKKLDKEIGLAIPVDGAESVPAELDAAQDCEDAYLEANPMDTAADADPLDAGEWAEGMDG